MQVKKIILGVAVVGLSTAIATSAVAAQPGFYAGLQAGYGNLNLGDAGKGLAGRVSAGYQFDQTFGAELGWSKFRTIEEKFTSIYYGNVPVGTFKATLKTDVVDLVGKATMPIANNVNVYGKLGGAYVMQRGSAKQTLLGTTIGSYSHTEKQLLPEAGVGISYDFNPNVAADVSYARIQKVGSVRNDIHSIDFVGAGLTYSFGS